MPSGDEARRGCRRQAGLHCRHVLCPLVSGDLRRDVGPPCRAALVVRKGGGQRSFAGLLGQRRSSSTATRTRLPSRMRRRSCWTCRSKLSSEIPRAAAALLRVRVTRDGAGHETAPGGARRACGGPGGPVGTPGAAVAARGAATSNAAASAVSAGARRGAARAAPGAGAVSLRAKAFIDLL